MKRKLERGNVVPLLLVLWLLLGACVAHAQQRQEAGTRCSRLSSSASKQKRAVTPVGAAAAPGAATATTRAAALTAARASETLIDASIADDAAMNAMLEPYRAKVRELDAVIGRLEGTLVKGRVVGGSMGNFVTDAVREEARQRLGTVPAVAILNRDGLRKNTIAPGELRARDIYQILPFENQLVAVDLTGAQLRRLLETLMAHRDLAQSGARVKFRKNEQGGYETTELRLIGPGGEPEEIDPARTYTIVTVDFVMTRGGPYDFLKEIKSVRPLNLMIRDAVTAYVKKRTAAGKAVEAIEDRRIDGPGIEEGEIT